MDKTNNSINTNKDDKLDEKLDDKLDNKFNNKSNRGCSCCKDNMFSFLDRKSKDLLCMDTFETNSEYDPSMINKPPNQKIIFNRKSNNK